MKNAKKIMIAGLLISAGYSALALAHEQGGRLGTVSGSAATDIYEVSCPTGTAKLYVSVKDLPSALPSLVSIQTTKNRKSSTLSVDGRDGDNSYSFPVTLVGGGTYMIMINKNLSSTPGYEKYSAVFHCQDARGNHLSGQPDPAMTQNQ